MNGGPSNGSQVMGCRMPADVSGGFFRIRSIPYFPGTAEFGRMVRMSAHLIKLLAELESTSECWVTT
jgi:hypothetical protein